VKQYHRTTRFLKPLNQKEIFDLKNLLNHVICDKEEYPNFFFKETSTDFRKEL